MNPIKPMPTEDEICEFFTALAAELQVPIYILRSMRRSEMPRKKKEVEIVFKPDMDLGQNIFDPIEREIIMADIAILKQEEKDSGAWNKWKRSQRQLGVHIEGNDPADTITRERFFLATGIEPQRDELERCNCTEYGFIGHHNCGWCVRCNKPVFMCGHIIRRA